MFKKYAMLIFCLTAGIFLTGCFGGMEVNDRAFVQLMGLDCDNGTYMATLQIYRSESGSSEPDTTKANSFAVSGEGETVSAAIADAGIKTGKSLFLGHIKMLIIGSGITEPAAELSLFTDGSVSPSCPVVFAEDPAAAAGTLLEDGTFSAERFMDLMTVSSSQGKTIFTSIADIVPERGAAVPIIIPGDDKKSVRFGGVILEGAGVAPVRIAEENVLGIKLLRDEFGKDDKITVPVSVNGRKATAVITGARTGSKAENIAGKLKISAEMRLKISTADDPYGIPGNAIEKAVRENIGGICMEVFSAAVQQEMCDIIGVEKLVRKYCPEIYNDYSSNSKQYLSGSELDLKIITEQVR